MAVQNNTVLVGNNEDWQLEECYVRFYPETDYDFGRVIFGSETWWAEGGMNTEGLFYDCAAISSVELNPHPEKQTPSEWIWLKMMKECSTVQEVINLFDEFYIGSPIAYQVLMADATGDGAVFTPGPEGEWNITRIENGYLVTTNFNLAESWVSPPCQRYRTADQMLSEIQSESNLTVKYFRSILEAVHNPGSVGVSTLYSNIYDLQSREIHLYYFHDFSEVVTFNLEDELVLGYHMYVIADLFEQTSIPEATSDTETTGSISTISITQDPFLAGLTAFFVCSIIGLILLKATLPKQAIVKTSVK